MIWGLLREMSGSLGLRVSLNGHLSRGSLSLATTRRTVSLGHDLLHISHEMTSEDGELAGVAAYLLVLSPRDS